MSKLHEECGVFGIYSEERTELAALAYYALYSLQHRGQESAGIVVNDDGVFSSIREAGLVGDVFSKNAIQSLGPGNIVVGHVRYSTTGVDAKRNVQPILIQHLKGNLALAHNGNLTNSFELRSELENRGSVFHTTTDSEVIAYEIVHARLNTPTIEAAVAEAVDKLDGAFSLVISSPTKLIVARDKHGFRPLCMGRRGNAIVFASETCAFDAIGATFERDVLPGEIITVSKDGIKSDKSRCSEAPKHLCAFEYIYFARPDSVIDGTNVHVARQRMGAYLAKAYPVDADIVIGVPDSGIDAAMGYAIESGLPYEYGFVKNKYIGRTFISPTQELRESSVNIKLNPIESVISGKRVVLIDDSIVRGTTCRTTISRLREAGAKEIHMRVSAPPFIGSCFYGTDIDSPENLIANNHTVDEIAQIIGVDSLGYLKVEDLKKVTSCGLCTACFDLNYPTSIPQDDGKSRFESRIHE